MSTFTKELTIVSDKALSIVTALHNDALPENATPLTEHEYLSLMFDGVLKSWQDQVMMIPTGEFLLRFPPGKIDEIQAAAVNSEELAGYIEELRKEAYVYTGSKRVRAGVAMLVLVGLLTQEQADYLLS